MRKLIVCNIMSLDGYFEGPGGNVMALPMDGFFDEHNLDRLRAADTLLLGATTYTGLKGYSWTETTTIVRRPDAHQAVAELKDQPGKEILMFGSRTLWNDLLVAGLVDELHLMVGATVLGGGTPTFGTGPIPPLRLVNIRRRDGSDNLLLRYEVISRDE